MHSTIQTKDGFKLTIQTENNYYKQNYPTQFNKLLNLLQTTTINAIESAIKLSTKDKTKVRLRIWLTRVTSFLDEKATKIKFTERIYCVLNNITETPKCKYCKKNPTRFLTLTKGYKEVCKDRACSRKASEEGMLKKYGVRCYLQSKEAHEKSKKTWLEKYGVDNPQKVKEINEKTIKTHKERYGAVGFQREDLLKKAKQVMKSKYGADNPMKVEAIKSRTIQRLNSPDTRAKIKNTLIERYGVDNISKIPESREKAYRTFTIRRLGIKNSEHWFDADFWLKNFLEDNNLINIKKAADYFGCSTQAIRRNLFRLGLENHRPTYSSITEQELANIISDFYTDTIIRNTTIIIPPYEIDIYLPELKLGIEYDGLYWHGIVPDILGNDKEIRRRRWNKWHKYNKASELGIKLFTIQQHAWDSNQELIISMLKAKLGLLTNKIPARKCEITQLTNEDLYLFFETNHLQGAVNCKYNFALVYNDAIVQAIALSPYRFTQQTNTIEIVRLATAQDTIVIGGFSKLIKHIKGIMKREGYNSIITFADRLYSTGDVYRKAGFKFVELTKPNYYYVDKHFNVYPRQKFQKHKLKNILEQYDPQLTEQENMLLNGYKIIYDAGHLKFIMQI